jgi:outer membrane receptor protein involved in Fe transport
MRYNTSSKEYLRVGARLEYTTFDRIADEFNFIPSASWSRGLPKNKSVSLSYSMGLRRPQLAFVNPTFNRSNPQYISHGNPDLGIEKIQQLTLSYNTRLLKSPLALTLYGSANTNAVQQYLYALNPETFAMTYANTGKV